MSVNGFQPVGVANYHILAVTAAFVIHNTHFTIKCGAHGIARVQADIHPPMHTPKAFPIAVIGGYTYRPVKRHNKAVAIYFVSGGDFSCSSASGKRIYVASPAVFAIKINSGILEAFPEDSIFKCFVLFPPFLINLFHQAFSISKQRAAR